ncbi:hypothetical protein F4802DRAFT_514906 [Xylaria palmicola]|nr:hypothetical protein F4802DRAFT_514906 [Xylaria palmicola]
MSHLPCPISARLRDCEDSSATIQHPLWCPPPARSLAFDKYHLISSTPAHCKSRRQWSDAACTTYLGMSINIQVVGEVLGLSGDSGEPCAGVCNLYGMTATEATMASVLTHPCDDDALFFFFSLSLFSNLTSVRSSISRSMSLSVPVRVLFPANISTHPLILQQSPPLVPSVALSARERRRPTFPPVSDAGPADSARVGVPTST